MKKFLLPMLLALAILIPSAQVQAADVPGFYQVGGRYLTFTGREDNGNGYRVYGYDCSVDLNEDFAERYMLALVNNYGFQFIGYFVNDYRRNSAEMFESWMFAYGGYKDVAVFIEKDRRNKQNYPANLVVRRHKNWQRETTHFSIKVAYGLTYGED